MEFKKEEKEEQVVLSVLEVEVEFKEEEEEQVIWWVLEVEVEFEEEGGGGTGDFVDVGGRGGVQEGRIGSF